jgi:DNA-binding NtrC family response regulator
MNKNVTDLTPETLEMLSHYEWPGNVRELRNVIERAMVGAKGTLIQPADLSFPFLLGPARSTDEDSMEDIEKTHIQKILDRTSGNIAQAAGILKISRLTLYNKIQKYNLKK